MTRQFDSPRRLQRLALSLSPEPKPARNSALRLARFPLHRLVEILNLVVQLLARVLASLFELDLRVVRRFLQFSVDFACFRADLGVGFVDGAAGVFDLEERGCVSCDIFFKEMVGEREQCGRSWSQLSGPIPRLVFELLWRSSLGLLVEQPRRRHRL